MTYTKTLPGWIGVAFQRFDHSLFDLYAGRLGQSNIEKVSSHLSNQRSCRIVVEVNQVIHLSRCFPVLKPIKIRDSYVDDKKRLLPLHSPPARVRVALFSAASPLWSPKCTVCLPYSRGTERADPSPSLFAVARNTLSSTVVQSSAVK